METEFNENISADTASSDEEYEYYTDSSDESDVFCSDNELQNSCKKRFASDAGGTSCETNSELVNLQQKLFNREHSGCFTAVSHSGSYQQRAFNKVPNRLSFCLKDIVPNYFLQGHIFMGFSACGQFLFSYKVSSNDSVLVNHYSFNNSYKYTLYFWIYQPHKLLRNFYKCCLFDDHGVDNLKDVTMTQWKSTDPRILIVHGASEDENEDSYVTYVKVPRLGCLDCKKLRQFDDEGFCNLSSLCLKCNLTIHTKYSSMESDCKFNPYFHLICPERILLTANGFIHMLHIELDLEESSSSNNFSNQLSQHNAPNNTLMFSQVKLTSLYEPLTMTDRRSVQPNESNSNDNLNISIVAGIIADFSDMETDSTHSNGSRQNESPRTMSIASLNETASPASRKSFDEIILSTNGNSSATSAGTSISVPSSNGNNGTVMSKGGVQVSSICFKGRRRHPIVTKSFRNRINKIDLQNPAPSSSSAADKSNAYEFSEDNEKCEKIATLRKRRLADKKYEFSEDNSENIIPFTKIRSAGKSFTSLFSGSSLTGCHSARNLHRSPATGHHLYNSPCASPSSSPRPTHASSSGCDSRHCTPPPMHRVSPISTIQQGFRSPPCSSPVGANFMRSPSRHVSTTQIYSQKSPTQQAPLSPATQQMLSFKPLGTLSPLQVSMTKRSHLEYSGSMSPNASVPFLSPRREEIRVVEVPLQGNCMLEKPICTKKFKRRYVEEDDAASVITSEEDDCISPGYHTSLPMEVHGSCYSGMQMISQASYQQLRCASVVITQHSFDLETFTYYIISALCQKNQKTYDVFYDWACEPITVCPLSYTIICVLMAQFSARDQMPTTPTNCLNCSKKLDCAFHRRQFECRILFTWNMESGEWEVLDYGELMECQISDIISPIKKYGIVSITLAQKAKKLATEMAGNLNKIQDYSSNLRVLDSDRKKSKKKLTDQDNMIELFLKHTNKL